MQEIVKVKIEKIVPEAEIPSYAHDGDAGLDLIATSEVIGKEGYLEFGTSLKITLPKGYVGLIYPRSSISKKNMMLANGVGVLDEGYTGEIKVRFKPSNAGQGKYKVGDKVAQLVIMPYPKIEFEEVESLDETERGTGGFGSTGE